MAISFAVLGLVVVLFIVNRLPMEMVAVGAALLLYATGVLTINQALAGFGDPTVIFIAMLFVVSEGLDAGGVTAWAGRQLIRRSGDGLTRLLVMIMLAVAVATAFISVNGAVAALLPVVVMASARLRQLPARLLLPLVFAAHAGSLLALTGTPVNVIVSDAAVDAGADPFGYFEFALVGVPLLAGTLAIVVLFGHRLIPDRTPRSVPPDFSEHARTLLRQYGRPGAFHLRVPPSSGYVGQTVDAMGWAEHPEVNVVAVHSADGGEMPPGAALTGDETLVVRGSAEQVRRIAAEKSLDKRPDARADDRPLFTRDTGVAEVVVPPRSGLIGAAVFPGMVTRSGTLVVVAVHRHGEDREGETVLAAGDTLLLEGTWDAFADNLDDPDVLVVDQPDLVRRQTAPVGRRGKRAAIVLVAMIVLLVTGVTAPVVAGLLGAGAMILLGVLNMQQSYRAISWTTVVLVAGMIPLSTAMQQTGAAEYLATLLVSLVGDGSPYLLLLALSVLTATMGQLISNTATALIVIPIAISAAADTGVSVQPVLMAVTVAAAASFLTPVATPVNLMVMGPAGYRFGDYWRLGLPLLLLFVAVATFLVPVFWPL
jgi:di/tricarboxylate transporter